MLSLSGLILYSTNESIYEYINVFGKKRHQLEKNGKITGTSNLERVIGTLILTTYHAIISFCAIGLSFKALNNFVYVALIPYLGISTADKMLSMPISYISLCISFIFAALSAKFTASRLIAGKYEIKNIEQNNKSLEVSKLEQEYNSVAKELQIYKNYINSFLQ